MDAASGVPWMPTYGEEIPIQRVPSGLPGPGGTGSAPSAQAEPSGGYHHGLRCRLMISKLPIGVGYEDWPVATRKTRFSLSPLKKRSWRESRLITISWPRSFSVTFGFSTS